MKKKKVAGKVSAPRGRPFKADEDKYLTPNRNLGRVDDETWGLLKKAAEFEGKKFIKWALPILVEHAKKTKNK